MKPQKKVISEYHEKLEEQKELENFLKGIDAEKNSQGSSTGTGISTAPTAAAIKPIYYNEQIVPQMKVTEKQSLELRQAFV